MKNNKFLIFIIIVVVILIIISIRIALSKINQLNTDNLTEAEITAYNEKKLANIEKKNLSEMGERDRMEYYVSSFIEKIENEEYDDAYGMLYNDYKKNYFPTYEEFVEYASKKFPKFAAIKHVNFERNGDLYVLWTHFSDSLGSKDSYKEIRFVVRENDLNDFELSFSAEL